MGNKLIVDAGSTKVDWRVISPSNQILASVMSEGINALLCDSNKILCSFRNVAGQLPASDSISDIFYYGAGCATPSICEKIKVVLKEIWSNAYIEVNSDLLGAARALFGNQKGIACILGTGSNSCLYDGKSIIQQIPSLGYIIGDEGSGAALGKRLIGDVFKQQLPKSVCDLFLEEYNLTLSDILDKVYRQQAPNKFLASLVPFLKKNLWNPYIYSLVLKELIRFVKRNVAMYPGAHSLNVSFTGSIAYNFQNLLKEATSSLGYSVASVLDRPMDGLQEYHK